ncbi:MAG: hypothetical protein SGI88_07945 [Candidatus Hydrogenedentes bacterium]|nr:hypothetical protein [Candidatus Hydrogenedentota bacterium]
MANGKKIGRSPADKQQEPPDWDRLFELWKKYEEIAMHFNDLILKVRIQALGGVAAVIAILLGLLGRKKDEVEVSWGAFAAGFSLILAMWIAIWLLDFLYYYRLLRGAVSSIVDIERQTMEHPDGPAIRLSKGIEQAVWHKRWGQDRFYADPIPEGGIEWGIWLFYGIVTFTLALCVSYSLIRWLS